MSSDIEETPPIPSLLPETPTPEPSTKKSRLVRLLCPPSSSSAAASPEGASTPLSSAEATSQDKPSARNPSSRRRASESALPTGTKTSTTDSAPDATPATSSKAHGPPNNSPLDFRQNLKGRAKFNCAADSQYFKTNKALIYNFLKIEDAKEDEFGKLASCALRCCICPAASLIGKWTYDKTKKGSGSTSNMNNHMESKHPVIWNEARRAEKQAAGIAVDDEAQGAQPTISGLFASSFNIDIFYDKLIRWITISNQPFSEIESEELLDVFYCLRPALQNKIIKSDALRDRITVAAAAQRQRFKDYLQNIPGLMPVALDAWTSSNRIAFLAIVGTFITADWKLEEVLLDFVEMHGAHDGKNMANCLDATVQELDVTHKLIALAADNASNNGTLVSEFTKIVKTISESGDLTVEIRWEGDKAQIRCLPHVVHLSVMSLLVGVKAVPGDTSTSDFSFGLVTDEEAEALALDDNMEALQSDKDATVDGTVDLGSSIGKVRKICHIVRSSPQRMEGFKKIVVRLEDEHADAQGPSYVRKKPLNLVLDVRTRWNSVLFMLERAAMYREAIDALCDHSVWKIYSPYRLSGEEWELVETIISWLKVFRRASMKMSGDKYVTLSSSLAVYVTLMNYVAKLQKSPTITSSQALQNGLSACYEKLQKFYDKSTFDTEYYYFATILDPRYKDRLFKQESDLFSEEWIDGCHDSFIGTLDRHYPPDPSQVLQAPVQPSTDSMEIDEFEMEFQALLPRPKETTAIPHRLELEQYLAEEPTVAEPLDWWRVTGQSRYPRLARMARDFLAIPGSSVSVERCLNIGRDVISLRRASLSADTIRLLMTFRAELLLEKRIAKHVARNVHKRTHT